MKTITETRMSKWADKRHKIEMAMIMLNDRLTMLENRVDELEDTVDALKEIVKYHDMKEEFPKEYSDRFDDMFDSPLETLEEIFKL